MRIKFYKQLDQMDCGPTCLRIVARMYGLNINIQLVRDYCDVSKFGVTMLGISKAAEKIFFSARSVKVSLETLESITLPCILHWEQNHFVVLYKIRNRKYFIADPAKGLVTLKEKEFIQMWCKDNADLIGTLLILTPTAQFYSQESPPEKMNLSFFGRYLFIYKKLIIQLFIGLTIGSILQLIAPVLTQSIVDIGINNRNIDFINLILIAQIALIIGRVSIELIRSWILLHISTRINISILTDFLTKLMKLPMSFFDSKMTGDILQRIYDQKRIEMFITGPILSTMFSLFNLIIFSLMLAFYNFNILLIFIASSILYVLWIFLFLKRRRSLDYNSFAIATKNQNTIIQLVTGMQEIKLNDCEQKKRWEWERIQAKLFTFSIKSLKLSQYQNTGATFINEGRNIFITYLSATAVLENKLTIGAMLAIQYIVGQLNGPIEQFVGFTQGYQDAKISLERLNEIHQIKDEEPSDTIFIQDFSKDKSIEIKNLSFSYPGSNNLLALDNINLFIPENKITAIVGTSGSGKTTLLKILLRFYEYNQGDIFIGKENLNKFSFKFWRSQCGVVMQDGFIFSDSIQNNIAVMDEIPDRNKIENAIKLANIEDLINQLPMGLKTKIGAEGVGLSQGQKQRILIARAIYKNPSYIFLDEATNALDAQNETIIMKNLKQVFTHRTVVIVAHRLSTVRKADNIIVLDKGRIIEEGTHAELTRLKGNYYALVKNQLELDNE